jgi:hypothetical protein
MDSSMVVMSGNLIVKRSQLFVANTPHTSILGAGKWVRFWSSVDRLIEKQQANLINQVAALMLSGKKGCFLIQRNQRLRSVRQNSANPNFSFYFRYLIGNRHWNNVVRLGRLVTLVIRRKVS